VCIYLCSGPSDHVFVNFVDHGAPGLVAFPRDELYADDLERALRKMAVNRQFARVSKTETIVAESFSLLR
jgi:legumain